MHTLPPYRRILLLTEGRLGVFTSKTAAVLLRYRAADIVGVVDSTYARRDIREIIPWSPPVPICAEVRSAAALRPDALFVGIAPSGGALPPELRTHVKAALEVGIDVVNGLHQRLADDEELCRVARGSGAKMLDLRTPPSPVVGAGRAQQTRCRRVLTVGTDCNVGKMVTAVELAAAARRRGLNAEFVATGQTGIMIAGRGVAADAVVSDFAAGAVEELVLSVADCDVCFVEGQGSLGHAGFSAVTLATIHGACPDALVLVHHAGRTHYRNPPHNPLPPLPALRDAYEQTAALVYPARLVAVALNTYGVERDLADAETARIGAELRVPAADPWRDGCEALLDAALEGIRR